MKKILPFGCSLLFTISLVTSLKSQTPTDAIMMSKGLICVAVVYTNDTWDEYWEGELLRVNGNVGTLTRQTIMPMATLGIGERFNIIAALPWAKTESSGGQIAGTSGLQDWGFWLKGTAIDAEIGPGSLTLHGTAGITGPASNYLADYGPYSLGLGCADGTLRGILQYKLNMGVYLRGQAGYHLRGNARAERDYYYTTHGVYSDKIDMPDAVSWGATLGTWLFNNSLKVEANYGGFNSLDGHDIRRQDVGFPSNEMINTTIGGGLQYYFPGIQGFGFVLSAHQVLTGRNVGKSTAYSAGVTYFFPVWKTDETEPIEN